MSMPKKEDEKLELQQVQRNDPLGMDEAGRGMKNDNDE
jgi:hypothetical protein